MTTQMIPPLTTTDVNPDENPDNDPDNNPDDNTSQQQPTDDNPGHNIN
jgi:hypothetical protein